MPVAMSHFWVLAEDLSSRNEFLTPVIELQYLPGGLGVFSCNRMFCKVEVCVANTTKLWEKIVASCYGWCKEMGNILFCNWLHSSLSQQ